MSPKLVPDLDAPEVEVPSAEAVVQQVAKILSSAGFINSEKASQLLRFIVQQAVNGGELNEYAIGVGVLGRPETFDPRIDPIVRVQVRRLRDKLTRYYQTVGVGDPVEIELPPRRYIPVARFRRSEPAQLPAAEGAMKSIALRPFQSLSSGKEDEYFADGLTDELIDAMASLKDIRLFALRAAAAPDRKTLNLRELQEQLKVQAVFEGRVRKAEDELRVSAQLTDVLDGSLIWSEIFARHVDDVFASQAEIAHSIVQSLRLYTDVPPDAEIANPHPQTPEPDHLASGRCPGNKGPREGLPNRAEYLTPAIAENVDNACAHSCSAKALAVKALIGESRPTEVMPGATSAALMALQLDPALVEAHIALGIISGIYHWDMEAAERHFLCAIEGEPGSAEVLQWYSLCCLLPSGRIDDGIAQIQRARASDRESPGIDTSLGYLLHAAGRYADALQQFDKAIELDPPGSDLLHFSYSGLGLVYEQISMLDSAVEAFETARELSGGTAFVLGSLGHAYAVSGRTNEAVAIAEQLKDESRRRYVPAIDIAMIAIGLGDEDEALEWLERAYEERCAFLASLKIDPRMKALHSDRRFQAILPKPA